MKLKSTKLFKNISFLVECFTKYEIFESSAMMTYYFLFSFFPLMILVNAIIGQLHINRQVLEEILTKILPEQIINFINSYLDSISNRGTYWLIYAGVILTIYSIARAIRILKNRIRILYDNSRGGGTFKEWAMSFFFSILILISFVVTILILLAGKHLINYLADIFSIHQSIVNFWLILRFVFIAAFIFLVLLSIYYFIPEVKQKVKECLPGTLFSMITWVAFTIGFSFYVDNMNDYSLVYGSIGVIIILLLWLNFTNTVILIGALINSIIWRKKQNKIKLEEGEKNENTKAIQGE